MDELSSDMSPGQLCSQSDIEARLKIISIQQHVLLLEKEKTELELQRWRFETQDGTSGIDLVQRGNSQDSGISHNAATQSQPDAFESNSALSLPYSLLDATGEGLNGNVFGLAAPEMDGYIDWTGGNSMDADHDIEITSDAAVELQDLFTSWLDPIPGIDLSVGTCSDSITRADQTSTNLDARFFETPNTNYLKTGTFVEGAYFHLQSQDTMVWQQDDTIIDFTSNLHCPSRPAHLGKRKAGKELDQIDCPQEGILDSLSQGSAPRFRVQSCSIPGTSCFYSRPAPKRSRKIPTREEQLAINHLRSKGACFRCRKLRLKCSQEDPCQNCITTLKYTDFKDAVLSSCIRSFSDADIFPSWAQNDFQYMDRNETLRLYRDDNAAFACFEFLLPLLGNRLWSHAAAAPSLSYKSTSLKAQCGTLLLRTLDNCLKRKDFWRTENTLQQVGLSFATDLLLAFYLHYVVLADSTLRRIQDQRISRRVDRKALETFTSCCRFNIEKILSLRNSVVEHLGFEPHSIFEDDPFQCCRDIRKHLQSTLRGPLFDLVYDLMRDPTASVTSDVNITRIPYKQRLLIQAIGTGVVGLPDLALKLGADPNADNNIEGNAVCRAIWKDDITTLRTLLKAGADFTRRTALNDTPFTCAISHRRLAALDLLVESGVTLKDLPHREMKHLVHPGNVWALEYLFEKAIHLYEPNVELLLHLAASSGNTKAVTFVIGTGAHVNDRDSNGQTALHEAAIAGSVDTVKLLLEAGADLESQDNKGDSALHAAASACCLDAVECLIAYGIDVDMRNTYGETALHVAAKGRYLFAKRAPSAVVKKLIEYGASVFSDTINGRSPFHIRIQADDMSDKQTVEVIFCLIHAGGRVNVQSGTDHLISYALRQGQSYVQYGVSSKAILSCIQEECQDFCGRETDTVLIALRESRPTSWYPDEYHAKVLVKLINAGLDPFQRNALGQTVLHIAVEFDCLGAVFILAWRFKTLLIAKDHEGRTARQYAETRGWRTIAETLRSLELAIAAGAVRQQAICEGTLSGFDGTLTSTSSLPFKVSAPESSMVRTCGEFEGSAVLDAHRREDSDGLASQLRQIAEKHHGMTKYRRRMKRYSMCCRSIGLS